MKPDRNFSGLYEGAATLITVQGSRLFIMQVGDGASGQFAAGFVALEAEAKAAHGAADTNVIDAAGQCA